MECILHDVRWSTYYQQTLMNMHTRLLLIANPYHTCTPHSLTLTPSLPLTLTPSLPLTLTHYLPLSLSLTHSLKHSLTCCPICSCSFTPATFSSSSRGISVVSNKRSNLQVVLKQKCSLDNTDDVKCDDVRVMTSHEMTSSHEFTAYKSDDVTCVMLKNSTINLLN